jgi:chromate transporter
LFAKVREVRLAPLSLEVPVWATVNVAALVPTVSAIVPVFRYKVGVLPVLGGAEWQASR